MEEQAPDSTLQPDLYFNGVRFMEPVIAFTSVLVALVCLYAWWRLLRLPRTTAVQALYRYFFLLMAFSTLIGGLVGHAFLYRFSLVWKLPGWLLGMAAIAALAQAAILHARPLLAPKWYRIFTAVNLAGLAGFIFVIVTTLNFHLVEAHAAFGLVGLVTTFEGYVYRRTGDAGSRLVLLSVPLAALAVLPHLFKFSLHTWFTYFDIGHLLMCASLWVMMLGAERVRAAGGEEGVERKGLRGRG
jgi:hypothetical protein